MGHMGAFPGYSVAKENISSDKLFNAVVTQELPVFCWLTLDAMHDTGGEKIQSYPTVTLKATTTGLLAMPTRTIVA